MDTDFETAEQHKGDTVGWLAALEMLQSLLTLNNTFLHVFTAKNGAFHLKFYLGLYSKNQGSLGSQQGQNIVCKMFVIDIGLVSQWTDCIMIIDKIFKNVQIVGTIITTALKSIPKLVEMQSLGAKCFKMCKM